MIFGLSKPITKEQYERAWNEHHGYLSELDIKQVFNECERLGYGIYSAIAYKTIDENGHEGYIVQYCMGNSCD